MSHLPDKPRRIWLRSFYGFSPEEDGYIGWSEEGPRDRMLSMIEDGDLFLIYGAATSKTEKKYRNHVIGFLQVCDLNDELGHTAHRMIAQRRRHRPVKTPRADEK